MPATKRAYDVTEFDCSSLIKKSLFSPESAICYEQMQDIATSIFANLVHKNLQNLNCPCVLILPNSVLTSCSCILDMEHAIEKIEGEKDAHCFVQDYRKNVHQVDEVKKHVNFIKSPKRGDASLFDFAAVKTTRTFAYKLAFVSNAHLREQDCKSLMLIRLTFKFETNDLNMSQQYCSKHNNYNCQMLQAQQSNGLSCSFFSGSNVAYEKLTGSAIFCCRRFCGIASSSDGDYVFWNDLQTVQTMGMLNAISQMPGNSKEQLSSTNEISIVSALLVIMLHTIFQLYN